MAMIEGVRPDHTPIDVFYTFRGEANAPHLSALVARVADLANVALHLHDTTANDHLTSATIEQAAAGPLSKAKVLFCGPASLRHELSRGLKSYGVPRRRFHYEEFEIRSDIWPLERINVPVKKWIAQFGF